MGLTKVAFEAIGACNLVEANERGIAYTTKGVVENMRGHDFFEEKVVVVIVVVIVQEAARLIICRRRDGRISPPKIGDGTTGRTLLGVGGHFVHTPRRVLLSMGGVKALPSRLSDC